MLNSFMSVITRIKESHISVLNLWRCVSPDPVTRTVHVSASSLNMISNGRDWPSIRRSANVSQDGPVAGMSNATLENGILVEPEPAALTPKALRPSRDKSPTRSFTGSILVLPRANFTEITYPSSLAVLPRILTRIRMQREESDRPTTFDTLHPSPQFTGCTSRYGVPRFQAVIPQSRTASPARWVPSMMAWARWTLFMISAGEGSSRLCGSGGHLVGHASRVVEHFAVPLRLPVGLRSVYR